MKQDESVISIYQGKYEREILDKFEMSNCKLVLSHIVPGYKLSRGRRW